MNMNLVLPGKGILKPYRGVDGPVLSRKCTQFNGVLHLMQDCIHYYSLLTTHTFFKIRDIRHLLIVNRWVLLPYI